MDDPRLPLFLQEEEEIFAVIAADAGAGTLDPVNSAGRASHLRDIHAMPAAQAKFADIAAPVLDCGALILAAVGKDAVTPFFKAHHDLASLKA